MVEVLGYGLSLLLLLAGTALVVAEALAPGAHFIVLGLALLTAGLVGLLLPPGLGVLAPLLLAAVVVVTGVASFYAYRNFDFYGGAGTDQTSDSDSLRGTTGRVTERVTPDSGEVKLDEGGGFNPYYRARSVDGEIPEGEEVMVVDPGGGNVITVESLSGGIDDIDRELARGRDRDETDDGDADVESVLDEAADGSDGPVEGPERGDSGDPGPDESTDSDPSGGETGDESEFETDRA
ncbi:MAG: NfeD family protein [Haloarculaceae archaeon]